VQTANPLGWPQNATAPVMLLTTSPITAGNSFSVGGVTVQVSAALPGGYAIYVRDASLRQVDHTAHFSLVQCFGAPNACLIPTLGIQNIAYRDMHGHMHVVSRDPDGITTTRDLTLAADVPIGISNPFGYTDPTTNFEILLYRGADGHVHSLYWSDGNVGHDGLSSSINAPQTTGVPCGWYTADNYHHVAYRGSNGHLHELWWTGQGAVGHGDLTVQGSAPASAGDPAGYVDTTRATNIVVYRATDGHVRSLYWTRGPVGLDDLSGFAGTPNAASDPAAYYTPHDDTHQVVYVGVDGHIHELRWVGITPVQGWDLTASAGAPPASGKPAAYYSSATNTKHVVYRSADGRLHNLSWAPGSSQLRRSDLTAYAGGPPAADSPAAFAESNSRVQHVLFRGNDNHLYEIMWEPLPDHTPITDIVVEPINM